MATERGNIGHGHVFPRPDGNRARCGGPRMCAACAKDLVEKNAEEARKIVVPEGWALVPLNPTVAMSIAGSEVQVSHGWASTGEFITADSAADIWKAMIAAAPAVPKVV